jgi:hypothetical protein
MGGTWAISLQLTFVDGDDVTTILPMDDNGTFTLGDQPSIDIISLVFPDEEPSVTTLVGCTLTLVSEDNESFDTWVFLKDVEP